MDIDPRLKAYAKAARTPAPDMPRTLLIGGGCGVGKTFAARAMFEWLTKSGREKPYLFTDWVNIISDRDDSLSAIFRDEAMYERCADAEARIARLARLHVLFIDDLGAEPAWMPPATMASGLCRIIEGREGRKQFTIITTNHTAQTLRPAYGDRLYSRLFVGGKKIILTGPDRRRIADE